MPSATSSATSESAVRSPASEPCCACHVSVARAHWCRRIPPSPIGFSTLWFGPATKPSREMDSWEVTLLMALWTVSRRRTHRLVDAHDQHGDVVAQAVLGLLLGERDGAAGDRGGAVGERGLECGRERVGRERAVDPRL